MENMVQTIKVVFNKEMGYLADAKNISCFFRSNWDLFQATQSKLGRKPIIPPPLEEKLFDWLLLIERKYFGCTRDDVRRLAFQLASCPK